jgi:1,6-anhydro-N-acetylmuramate kinase
LGGQTVWEQTVPLELGGAFVTGVLEAGDPAAVAEAIGVPVVSGFRAREMAAGGEGDPVKRCLERLPGDIAGLGGAAEPEIAARAVAIAILADGTLLGLPGTGTDGDDLVAPGSVTPGRR